MGYEANTGLGVKNQYGARKAGGYIGDYPGDSYVKSIEIDLPLTDSLGSKFPVTDGGAYVSRVDKFLSSGTVTALTIGGVDVVAADEGSEVNIPDANTGVIAVTGTGVGKVIVYYKQ